MAHRGRGLDVHTQGGSTPSAYLRKLHNWMHLSRLVCRIADRLDFVPPYLLCRRYSSTKSESTGCIGAVGRLKFSTIPSYATLMEWWAWVDLNHRPRPYQGSVVRFYNNLQDRGDCQNTRKSYKASQSVGWVMGYRSSNTLSKHLQGAGWRIIKDGLIPILVRGPKNSVLLHPGDYRS